MNTLTRDILIVFGLCFCVSTVFVLGLMVKQKIKDLINFVKKIASNY